VYAVHCVQLLHTILHRTDLIIFPLTLQTITTAPMMSIWGKGGGEFGLSVPHWFSFSNFWKRMAGDIWNGFLRARVQQITFPVTQHHYHHRVAGPFLQECSRLVNFALDDRRLPDQCRVVWDQIPPSRARCDAVGVLGGTSPLANGHIDHKTDNHVLLSL